MSIAENIKRIRLEHGLSQSELGKIAGVSDKAVSTWELGLKTPRMGAVEKMANYFGITKSAIVDDAPMTSLQKPVIPPGFEPMPKMKKVPLIGSIACGDPITAEQNIEKMVDVPENIRCDFSLTCRGAHWRGGHPQAGVLQRRHADPDARKSGLCPHGLHRPTVGRGTDRGPCRGLDALGGVKKTD